MCFFLYLPMSIKQTLKILQMREPNQTTDHLQLLQALAEHLSFCCGYLPTINLYEGKIGALLALALHAKSVGDTIYEEQVIWLFERIVDEIDCRLGIGIEDGLAGVGYGMTLLFQLGAVAGDLDDALAEIDERIMEFDPRRIKDLSFRHGLRGVMAYVRLRQSINPAMHTFDISFLQELEQRCSEIDGGVPDIRPDGLLAHLDRPSFEMADFSGKSLGLSGGLSYYLLRAHNALLSF